MTGGVVSSAGRTIVLGLGQLEAVNEPGAVLVCVGLGSCVAVCAHDPMSRVSGMGHFVLPTVTGERRGADEARFVDLGIPRLIDEMLRLGAIKSRLVVKLVGGAQMIPGRVASPNLNIGSRNIETARGVLGQIGLPVKAADTGGSRGRTVRLFSDTGRLVVSTVGGATHEL